MKGAMSAQKALQGFKTETRDWEEPERIVFPGLGVIVLPSRQINDFLQQGNKEKIELVARPE